MYDCISWSIVAWVGAVLCGCMDKKQATAQVRAWTQEHIEQQEFERFREVDERELLSLHE